MEKTTVRRLRARVVSAAARRVPSAVEAARTVRARYRGEARFRSADAGDALLAAALRQLPVAVQDAVVVSGPRAIRTAELVAATLPGCTVHVLVSRRGGSRTPSSPAVRVHSVPDGRGDVPAGEVLCRLPQPQLIIDRGRSPERTAARFTALVLFLQEAGIWLAERPVSAGREPEFLDLLQPLLAVRADPASAGATRREAALSSADPELLAGFVAVRKQLVHRIKVRDRDATALLNERYGTSWGEVVTTRPPTQLQPRVELVVHGDAPNWAAGGAPWGSGDPIPVPELSLRRYRDAQSWQQQRLAKDNLWLPDTFRHPMDTWLRHRNLLGGPRWHARLPAELERVPRQLSGNYFWFDTEYPVHFGHILTEVVSRHWGWQQALERAPDLRPLVSLAKDATEMPAYERIILTALGVDVDRVEYVAPDETVRIESLYAASPMFVMPHYVSPELMQTWRRIADNVVPDDERPTERPRRLFIARKVRRIRSCTNTDEVEAFFTELGFTLFYPEQHSFAEQLATFAAADIVAGFAGSGMFSLMFAAPKTSILISPDGYTANNEYLIAALTGGRMHLFPADSQIKQPPGRWTWEAYQSNFSFDVARHAAALRRAVEDA